MEFILLEQKFEQRLALSVYATNKDIPSISSQNWSILENVIRVLKPFEELTQLASSD